MGIFTFRLRPLAQMPSYFPDLSEHVFLIHRWQSWAEKLMPMQWKRKPGLCHTAVNKVFPTSGCKRCGHVVVIGTPPSHIQPDQCKGKPPSPRRILAESCGVRGVRGVRSSPFPHYNNIVNLKRERTPRHTSPSHLYVQLLENPSWKKLYSQRWAFLRFA